MAFPASPSDGDEYTNGVTTWTYVASDNRWDIKAGTSSPTLSSLWEADGSGYLVPVSSPSGSVGLWQVTGSYVELVGSSDTDDEWDLDGSYVVPAA